MFLLLVFSIGKIENLKKVALQIQSAFGKQSSQEMFGCHCGAK